MSRILLIGMGTPSFVRSDRHAGPGLRCGHFAVTLSRAGHELLTVCSVGGRRRLAAGAEPQANGLPGPGHLMVGEEDFGGSALDGLLRDFRPQATVAATAYAAALATRLRLDVPLWADVFGDFMAEAQAKAVAAGSDYALVHFWTLLRPVLERADRFSAVSRAQALALIGQIGLAGRLSRRTAGERLVEVIPCAAEPWEGRRGAKSATESDAKSAAGLRGTVVGEDAFIVLWTGGFNTWCDVATMVAGLERAMDEDASIHLVTTGGSIPGHDERTYAAFRSLVASSRHRRRFHIQGWVDSASLPAYYLDADVGLNVEKSLYERRLGSENRVVGWMAHGLACVTSALSELGEELVAKDLAFGFTPGEPASLAAVLVGIAGDRRQAQETGRRALAYVEAELGYEQTARPLLDWCARPHSAGDARGPRPVTVGLLSRPDTMVELLEAYLDDLTLGQAAYRSLRWLVRRIGRGPGITGEGDRPAAAALDEIPAAEGR